MSLLGDVSGLVSAKNGLPSNNSGADDYGKIISTPVVVYSGNVGQLGPSMQEVGDLLVTMNGLGGVSSTNTLGQSFTSSLGGSGKINLGTVLIIGGAALGLWWLLRKRS